jgi:signal transduction histidine kinase
MTAFQTHITPLHSNLSHPAIPLFGSQVYNQLPDGFILLDENEVIIEINARAEQILCCVADQVLYHRVADVLPNLVMVNGENICLAAIEHNTDIHFEQVYHPYGLMLEVVVSPCAGGLFLYLRDVTMYRKTSASLQEYTHLSALNTRVSCLLAGADSLSDMLQRCLEVLIEELSDIKLARVWIFNSESHLLSLEASASAIAISQHYPKQIPLGLSIVGVIAQSRVPYRTNHLHRDRCLELQQWSSSHDLNAFIGYPLVVDNRLMGVITLFSQAPICEATYTALQWIFSSMAIAIDRSLARAQLLSRRESLLFRLANQIRKSLDLNTILAIAVQEIRQLLNIDGCHFLWCLMGNADHCDSLPTLAITHESIHLDFTSLLGECSPELGGLLIQPILRQELLNLEDISQAALEELNASGLHQWMEQLDIQSFLLLPLETHAGQLGAIACSHRQARPWSPAEIELLYAVTDQLAIAIDQAELYARSRAAALAAQSQAHQLNQTLQTLRQTQAQMIQNEKMSSLGQLVAGIAHEINNPVGFVSGNLTHAEGYFKDLAGLIELYQTHYPTPHEEIQTYIEEIELPFLLEDYASLLSSMQIGTERITKIVLSLRNFSRLDEAAVKSVDLHQGIDSTLLILHNRLKARGQEPGIEVVKQYGNLPLINCYASQLNQVFLNLLSNAIDALQGRPVPRCITIATHLESRPQVIQTDFSANADESGKEPETPWVVIRIQDNGTGMPEEIRAKVFDPFFTTKPVGQGTGLGLSISHQIIIEKHHGQLTCQSELGKGTTFTIEIPV